MKLTIKVETKGATVEVHRDDTHLSVAVVSALLGLAKYHPEDEKLQRIANGVKNLVRVEYDWTMT